MSLFGILYFGISPQLPCFFFTTDAGWNSNISGLGGMSSLYAFLFGRNRECHYDLFLHVFSSSWSILGFFLCLCNNYICWSIIYSCFCYIHCHDINNRGSSVRYGYVHLFLSLELIWIRIFAFISHGSVFELEPLTFIAFSIIIPKYCSYKISLFITIEPGWAGFLYSMWLLIKKGVDLASHSLSITGSAVSVFSSPRNAKTYPELDEVSNWCSSPWGIFARKRYYLLLLSVNVAFYSCKSIFSRSYLVFSS